MIPVYVPAMGRVVSVGDEGRPVAAPTPVYRLEMPNGRGPYNSGRPDAHAIYDVICAEKPGFDCSRLAEGEQMGLTEYRFREAHGDASYGCESLEALGQWFPRPAREYLARYGVRMVEYVVPRGAPLLHTQHGEVVFDRAHAHRVAAADPLSF